MPSGSVQIGSQRNATLSSEKNKQLYISAFDGAHLVMPKYTDSYENVKNLAPVEDCLKG